MLPVDPYATSKLKLSTFAFSFDTISEAIPGGALKYNVVSRRDQENTVKGLFLRSRGVRMQHV